MMRNILIPALVTVIVCGVMVFQASTPPVYYAEARTVALPEIAGYEREAVEVSEAEHTVLPADTQFDKRRYFDAEGRWFLVTLVTGGRSKSSIHRPELCLPAQGFLMAAPHTREVAGISWRMIRLEGGAERPSLGFAYTFFNQTGFRTSSHVRRILRDIWDRSVLNRIDRWSMITVNASSPDEEALAAFLAHLKGVVE